VNFFQFFNIQQGIVCTFSRPDQFIQLDLDRFRVAVLGALDEKDHHERNDGCRGIDDQLPRITELEHWSRDYPNQDCPNGQRKNDWSAAKP
jgi:hypothetical protein